MATWTEDALALGERLKAEERAASLGHIERMFTEWPSDRSARESRLRMWLAQQLYESKYDGYAYDKLPDAAEILDNFCQRVFRGGFEEVIKAWDRELG